MSGASEFVPAVWNEHLVELLRPSMFAGLFPPPPPPTRRQRIKARIRRARMALASRIAGFDVEIGCEW